LNVGGRGYHLTRALDVAATAVAVDQKSVLLRLDADLSSARTTRLRAGSITAAGGVLSGGVLVGIGALIAAPAILPFIALAAIPTAVGAGSALAVFRSHRGVAERTKLALEQALDAMEHAPPQLPNPAAALLGALLPKPKR
jgi:hypothetical protein